MANIISDETIEYVGILAKLELSPEEKEQAKKDMGNMLDYIDMLNELDTEGVEPMSLSLIHIQMCIRDRGEEMCAKIADAKKKEWEEYNAQVSQWEIDSYLLRVQEDLFVFTIQKQKGELKFEQYNCGPSQTRGWKEYPQSAVAARV